MENIQEIKCQQEVKFVSGTIELPSFNEKALEEPC